MSGAWEQTIKKNVLVGILHVDNVTLAWALGLRNLIIPGGDIAPIAGAPFDHARNALAQKALHEGYEWLFFLDSDVVPPPDVILRLMAHGLPIVSGLYSRRSPPVALPVMQKPIGQWVTRYQSGTLVEVDVVGAGCLLIHRSVLANMPPHRPGKPWFDWRVDMQGHMPMEECLSEDFSFCTHAKKKMGIKTIVDTSIICRHIGFGESTPGEFKPMETRT